MCGIMGVYGEEDASVLVYQGLYALQHRGQESCGIASNNNGTLSRHIGMGLVNDVFNKKTLNNLSGSSAIGHNRYSTTGGSFIQNAQPLIFGSLALSHNGNFINSEILREELIKKSVIFDSTTDTEIFLQLLKLSKKNTIIEKIQESFTKIQGAYSMLLLTDDALIAIRDPRGFRPLCLGKKDGSYFIASETCPFDLIGVEYEREVYPGEILLINKNGLKSYWLEEKAEPKSCIFEYVYFSRPDSKIFGNNVDKTRRRLGRNLAIEHPADADIVISVPDSSNTAALGYSDEIGIRFELGLIRNHYVGRTFIHPDQKEREFKVRVKFNAIEGILKGRRVVIVDDSIVRGTTLKQLIKILRKVGVKEVHVRSTSPPIISPCYYGMDFPTEKELIASNKTTDEIREFLKADTLGYLSLEGMIEATGHKGFCTACFTKKYPIC